MLQPHNQRRPQLCIIVHGCRRDLHSETSSSASSPLTARRSGSIDLRIVLSTTSGVSTTRSRAAVCVSSRSQFGVSLRAEPGLQFSIFQGLTIPSFFIRKSTVERFIPRHVPPRHWARQPPIWSPSMLPGCALVLLPRWFVVWLRW
jgi:hypothetical protein